ncbi:MAG: hypothetical protein ACE5NG_09735 [bacterium]
MASEIYTKRSFGNNFESTGKVWGHGQDRGRYDSEALPAHYIGKIARVVADSMLVNTYESEFLVLKNLINQLCWYETDDYYWEAEILIFKII